MKKEGSRAGGSGAVGNVAVAQEAGGYGAVGETASCLLVRYPGEAERVFHLQVGVAVFLRMVASQEEGDTTENYQRNVEQIRGTFADLGCTFESALEFIAEQIKATGVKITQRRHVSMVKALLPDEYPFESEVEEIFRAYNPCSPFADNVLNFPYAQAEPIGG